MAQRNADIIARLRQALATLVGAASAERVALTPGATDAMNMAILGLLGDGLRARRTGPTPRVVTTVLEHNAVRRPLAYLQDRGVITWTQVPCDAQGLVDPAEVLKAVDDSTVILAMMHAANGVGTILPALEVCRTLRTARPDVITLIDAAQTIGVLPIDVQRDNIDLLAFPGHKALMGPTGIGVLCVSPRLTGEGPSPLPWRIDPIRFGGTGGDSGKDVMPSRMPAMLEPGTHNTIACVGLLAAMEAPGVPRGQQGLAHERAMVARVIEHLSGRPGVRIIGPRDVANRVGVVTITMAGWAPGELASALDAEAGVCVRSGLLCAPGAHKALGTFDQGGTVRISPGVYNTDQHIDVLLSTLDRLASTGGRR